MLAATPSLSTFERPVLVVWAPRGPDDAPAARRAPGRGVSRRPARGGVRQLHARADRSARSCSPRRWANSPAHVRVRAGPWARCSRPSSIARHDDCDHHRLGTHSLPGFEQDETEALDTPFGQTSVTRGRFAGVDALHVSRHGSGHVRLSNHVTHRANIWALKQLGATAVIACTACGAVDPSLELGSLVVFDDLHFASNRLPDGSLCTFFVEPGDRRARPLDPPRRPVLRGGPPGAARRCR